MAVCKTVLRNLLGVRLARLELLEPTGSVAKSVFSVASPGQPADMRYFRHVSEAEVYFFEQVRKMQARREGPSAVGEFLTPRRRLARLR